MMYQNYPYRIFNPDYLNAYQEQKKEAQRQWEQNKNVADLVKALSDFLDASGKVHPDFQKLAWDACAGVILDHMRNNNGGHR